MKFIQVKLLTGELVMINVDQIVAVFESSEMKGVFERARIQTVMEMLEIDQTYKSVREILGNLGRVWV